MCFENVHVTDEKEIVNFNIGYQNIIISLMPNFAKYIYLILIYKLGIWFLLYVD